MENKEENTTIINKENNDYNLTKRVGWIIGTYFLGFSPMIFLYGLFNMCITPSLKYMNIMLSAIVFYYFGFIELAILAISLSLLYLNNNYDLIKNKISKIIFFYNSLKKANTLETSINPEFETIANIINKINKYELLINKYIEKMKQLKLNKSLSFVYIHIMTLLNKYVNKLEYLLNNVYQKIQLYINKLTDKIKNSSYVVKKIEPVVNVIHDVIQEKNDIEMQDEYITTKKTLDIIKNDIINNTSLLDGEQLNTEEEITNKFQHMEKELEQFDNLINELNNLDTDNNNPQNMTEEEMIKSLDLINLFGKMMKITELEPEDKQKCKNKIKEEIMDTKEFMNLLNNSFS